jgi:hypothetical protein
MFRSRLFKPGRLALLVALVATSGLLTAASADGVTASVTPGFQAVCSGCTATWGAAWGDVANYDVTFYYGDGGSWTQNNISFTSKGFSRQFYTCTGGTYYQHLHVKDGTGATADAYVSTGVGRGNICAPGG